MPSGEVPTVSHTWEQVCGQNGRGHCQGEKPAISPLDEGAPPTPLAAHPLPAGGSRPALAHATLAAHARCPLYWPNGQPRAVCREAAWTLAWLSAAGVPMDPGRAGSRERGLWNPRNETP